MAKNIINEDPELEYPAIIINTKNTAYKWEDQLTGEPYGTAEIVIDGYSKTIELGADGKWSYDPTSVWESGKWAEGEHVIQVRTFDAGGNDGDPLLYILNIDNTPPAAPEIWRVVDNTGSDMGNLTPGQTSDERKPVISGVAEPESMVYLYDKDGTTPIGEARADKMGAWTITPELGDGDHILTVTSQDAATNTSVKSTPFNMTISGGAVVFAEKGVAEASEVANETAGVGTFEESKDSLTTPRTYLSSGKLELGDNTGEGFVKVQVAIGDYAHTFYADANGDWSFNGFPELPDGTYVYQVRYCDLGDNWGEPLQQIFVIDSSLPEKPQIMRVIDDNGATDWLTSGHYTNDTTPTISGVAAPGSTVFIYDINSSAPIGSMTVGADGRWTFTTPELVGDTHAFTAEYKDRHGRTSPKSDNFVIKLDTSTPVVPKVEKVWDDEGTVGLVESGKATDDKTPIMSGAGTAGSTVRIWEGDKLIASTIVDQQGRWEIVLPDQDDGTHNLRIDAVSKGGTESAGSDNFQLVVDSKMLPPTQIDEVIANNGPEDVVINDGDTTGDATPVLRGKGNDGEIIIISDNGKPIGSTVVENGKWEFEIPEADKLDDSEHKLVVRVEDPNTGKSSGDSDPVTIVVDTTPPEKPSEPTIIDHEGDNSGQIVAPGEPIDDSRPEFGGEDADKDDIVKIIIRDENGNDTVIGTTIVGEGGEWTIRPEEPIPDGDYEVIVVITDPVGNESDKSDPIQLIIDTKEPGALTDLVLTDNVGLITGRIENGTETDDDKPVLTGKGQDGTKVIIYDGEDEIGSVIVENGEWSFELPQLAETEHSIKVQPVSGSGKRGEIVDVADFIVDTSIPTSGTFDSVHADNKLDPDTKLPVERDATAGPGEVNDQTLIMRGTGTDGDLVIVYGDQERTNIIGSTTVENGVWRLDTEELPEAWYHFTASFFDKAGNELAIDADFKVKVDITPPKRPSPVPASINELEEEDLMHMSLNDIIANSNDSLFIDNGKTQLVVSEKAGKEVTLEDILPKGEDVNNWSQANGTVTVAGVEYDVYQNNGGDAEVLVQHNLIQEQQH
ncbi:Ig-like domain-containing protein [Pantoea sp. GM01]|uniref:Ig-like domain-containing protein n=1 Tax=Pantoea sp. GM01 TaxID=1144320 RepID=UPI000270E982|nr:Ig-like domain-containing protein [Pantoea sp. GM01]EJL88058.1 hypothetical protein PMI17_02818 [Pantoea sp. GM01]